MTFATFKARGSKRKLLDQEGEYAFTQLCFNYTRIKERQSSFAITLGSWSKPPYRPWGDQRQREPGLHHWALWKLLNESPQAQKSSKWTNYHKLRISSSSHCCTTSFKPSQFYSLIHSNTLTYSLWEEAAEPTPTRGEWIPAPPSTDTLY